LGEASPPALDCRPRVFGDCRGDATWKFDHSIPPSRRTTSSPAAAAGETLNAESTWCRRSQVQLPVRHRPSHLRLQILLDPRFIREPFLFWPIFRDRFMPNRRGLLSRGVDHPQFLLSVLAPEWKVRIEQLTRIVEERLVQIANRQRV